MRSAGHKLLSAAALLLLGVSLTVNAVLGQAQYTVCYNLDNPGVGDISIHGEYGIPESSLQTCAALCSATSGCVGAVYYQGRCWPKNQNIITAPTATLTSSQYLIQSGYHCPAPGSAFIETKYWPCSNLDSPGIGDIWIDGVLGVPLDTVQDCMELCSETAACIAGVYYQGKCYPKNNAVLSNPTTSLSPDTYFITNGYSCPSAGGGFAVATYTQCASLDTPGVGDIAVHGEYGLPVSSEQACMALCSSTAGCIGAVYYQGRCWMKNNNIVTSPTTALSGTIYLIASTYGCPVVGSTFIETDYVQCSNLDNPGVGDIWINGAVGVSLSSVPNCMELCSSTSGCIAAIYYQGKCYPKNNAIIGSATTALSPDTYFITPGHYCPAPGSSF